MTPVLKVKPGVRFTGLQTEMTGVLDVVPRIFARYGHDCWLTCAVEPRSSGKHPNGGACDFDSSTDVSYATGRNIEKVVSEELGAGFDVVWHGPRWHLHVEWDPKPSEVVVA